MRLAICGTTGPVVEGFLEKLDQAGVSSTTLSAFALSPEDDACFRFDGKTIRVEPLADADFAEYDLLLVFELLPACDDVAATANSSGCHVIDAAGNGQGRVVVPELMHDERVDYPVFWSLPAAFVSALAPVVDGLLAGNQLQSLTALVCESASALGEEGTRQLAAETARLMNGQGIEGDGPQRAFNLLPGDVVGVDQARLCLEDLLGVQFGHFAVSCLQVPVFYGQTIQLSLGFSHPVQRAEALEIWLENGIHVLDNKGNFSPVALAEDDRIHIWLQEGDSPTGASLTLWIIADNIRKSAVVNTIQLMEILIKSSI